jgi:UDP-N-acetylglucosamine--N-acetylmuramyl-(pentapeptide) pyrophosphoryl-undecaprenol N-acetylglucosamine transferase
LTIVLTGGGSGGHITPILAVAAEIKKQAPKSNIIYIGQKGDRMASLPAEDPNVDTVYLIYAGKFRRFHGEGFKQLLDIPTIIKNIRDLFFIMIGTFQSWRLIKKIKPEILFSRGGYVSVPVALGAHFNHVPYITHDSDPISSLANRIIAPWAKVNAVALPKEVYPYNPAKTVTTGIPLNKKFIKIDAKTKSEYRTKLGYPKDAKVLFIIGGGLGSQTLNDAFCDIIPHLLRQYQDLYVAHVAGNNNIADVEDKYKQSLSDREVERLKIFGYTSDVYLYSGAADVVVTRAGATNLAEFAVQGKACVVIPSPFLTGGHQLKNAEYLESKEAVIVCDEYDIKQDANKLAKILISLLQDKAKQKILSTNLLEFAQPNATEIITDIILNKNYETQTTS